MIERVVALVFFLAEFVIALFVPIVFFVLGGLILLTHGSEFLGIAVGAAMIVMGLIVGYVMFRVIGRHG